MRNGIFVTVIVFLAVLVGGYFYGERRADIGYDIGYKAGYKAGYTDGYENANALKQQEIADAVQAHSKTETKIVYQTIPYTGADVQVHTEKPVVTVDINGKQQQVQQHSETADLAVKTETAVKISVPERKWSIGIGTDGRQAAYMLKAPIKGAVGAWVAGSGRHKIMGGVSISF